MTVNVRVNGLCVSLPQVGDLSRVGRGEALSRCTLDRVKSMVGLWQPLFIKKALETFGLLFMSPTGWTIITKVQTFIFWPNTNRYAHTDFAHQCSEPTDRDDGKHYLNDSLAEEAAYVDQEQAGDTSE